MRNCPPVRQIELLLPEHEEDNNLFQKLPRKMCRISYNVGHAKVHAFFEYSGPSIVFLIAAAVWDSRGVLAFRTTICDYRKLLFRA